MRHEQRMAIKGRKRRDAINKDQALKADTTQWPRAPKPRYRPAPGEQVAIMKEWHPLIEVCIVDMTASFPFAGVRGALTATEQAIALERTRMHARRCNSV
jgi:hypothetical protein